MVSRTGTLSSAPPLPAPKASSSSLDRRASSEDDDLFAFFAQACPPLSDLPVAPPPPVAAPVRSVERGGAWVAYTDGACSGNPGPAGLGVVLISPEGVTYEGFEYLGSATNNLAELTAIRRALEGCPREATSLMLHTDSQYALGVLTKAWKPKIHQQLILEIRGLLAQRAQVKIHYVPAHSGIALNERADMLARYAVTSKGTRLVRV